MQFDASQHLANALEAHDQANNLDPNPHNRATREALLSIASSLANIHNRMPAKTEIGITTSVDNVLLAGAPDA